MVSETGEIFDTFQLNKPVGWTNNVTNQTTFATNFQSTYVPSAAELYGYTGSSEAIAAILAVVAANPSNYTSLQVTLLEEASKQGGQQSSTGPWMPLELHCDAYGISLRPCMIWSRSCVCASKLWCDC